MKLMKQFWLSLTLLVCGCTTITLEVASVPSIKPWDSVPDKKMYTYNKSLDDIVEFSDVNISLSLTNYETQYRGLAMLGVELERWPNSKFDSDEIILALGVTPLKNGLELMGEGIALIMKVDGGDMYVKPHKVMKYNRSDTLFCGFDNSIGGWGGRSIDIGNKKESLLKGSHFSDNCYNLYFELPKKVKDVDFALDFSESLLPLNSKVVYFHKKLIKWTSSN